MEGFQPKLQRVTVALGHPEWLVDFHVEAEDARSFDGVAAHPVYAVEARGIGRVSAVSYWPDCAPAKTPEVRIPSKAASIWERFAKWRAG